MMNIGIPKQDERPSQEIVENILKNTDWNTFWQTVMDSCAEELEAYRIAEAKSRNNCHVFV